MRSVLIRSLVALFVVAGLRAQPKSEVMYDNDQVRVVKVTMGPHQRSPMHEHPGNRLLICLDGGQATRTLEDGTEQPVEFHAGDVYWAPVGGSYSSENTSDQAFQIIEIVVKGKPQPPAEITDLDPLKVDAKHYHLELENDQVRVVRVRFGPLEKGVLHQHVRNYLVVYMTKQAKGDRGDVRLHFGEGSVTHTEDNPLNAEVERIAVELK